MNKQEEQLILQLMELNKIVASLRAENERYKEHVADLRDQLEFQKSTVMSFIRSFSNDGK